jgi:hypothetical protein
MNTGEHPGVPSRPPASAHLMVSSTDRYATFNDRLFNPTTASVWSFNKAYNLLYGYFTRLAITQIQLQYMLPVIVPGVNDILEVDVADEDGGVYSFQITIPAGYYNGADLASAIQTLVRAEGTYEFNSAFTCTFNDGYFGFSVATGYILTLTNDVTNTTTVANNINKLHITMGLVGPTALGPANSLFSASFAPLSYTRWIDICSSRLTQFQRVKDATTLPQGLNSDVIARIYLTAPNVKESMLSQPFTGPFNICIDYNTPKHIKWTENQAVNNFDIQVRDEFGELLYWDQDYPTEYQLTLLASET